MRIDVISKDQWLGLSEDAFLICFGVKRQNTIDRIDFAYIGVDDSGTPAGFITCMEHDAETVYWQFGGMFPDHIGTIYTWQIYKLASEESLKKYKKVFTRIENTNIAMLKLAIKIGFLIVGIKVCNNKTLLELELKGE